MTEPKSVSCLRLRQRRITSESATEIASSENSKSWPPRKKSSQVLRRSVHGIMTSSSAVSSTRTRPMNAQLRKSSAIIENDRRTPLRMGITRIASKIIKMLLHHKWIPNLEVTAHSAAAMLGEPKFFHSGSRKQYDCFYSVTICRSGEASQKVGGVLIQSKMACSSPVLLQRWV